MVQRPEPSARGCDLSRLEWVFFAACDVKDRQMPGVYKITARYEYQYEKAISNQVELTLAAR